MIETNFDEQQDIIPIDFKTLIPKNFHFFSVTNKHFYDLLSVLKYDRQQTEAFLQCLLNGQSYMIDVTTDNRQIISQLYFDAQNAIKTKGDNKLAVAYPFFYEKTDNGSIFSPLFLFKINFELGAGQNNDVLTISSQNNIIPNHYLFDYIKKQYGLDFSALIADKTVDVTAVVKEIVEKTSKKLNLDLEYVPNKIFPVQDRDILEKEINDNNIYFNAIIGNYETPSEQFSPFSFSRNEGKIESNVFHYGLFGTDVAQHNALSKIREQVTVMTGHAGTGKTHSIANFASFALSKGKKVLVINNNQRALLQVQEFFIRWNLDKFSFVIKNSYADKTVMLDILKAIENSIDDKIKGFNFKNFDVKAESLEKLKAKLAQSYSHLQKDVPVAGNWQNLLGYAIHAKKTLGNKPALLQINPKIFTFQGDEFYFLRSELFKAQALHEPLQTLNHPLSNLHDRLFRHLIKEDALNEVNSHLNLAHFDLMRLYNQGNAVVENYRNQQRNIYKTHFVELSRKIDTLNAKIDDNTKLYDSTYLKPGLWQSLFGNWSKNGKAINQALKETREAYSDLAGTFASKRFIQFNFPKNNSLKPQKINNLLKEFAPKLIEWNNTTEARIGDEIRVLNPKFAVNFESEVKKFDDELHIVIDQFNQSEIYTEKFEVPGKSLTVNLKYVDSLLDKIKTTQKDMAAFEDFHPFRNFWLASDEKTKHLVECSVATKNEEWESAFDAWYFEQLLQRNYNDSIPQHTDNHKDIVKKEEELMLELAQQIDAVSYNRRYEILRQARRKSESFNRVFGKNSQNLTTNMKELFNRDFDVVTETFPLILTTLEVANEVLSNQQFDYVILDDAQQINLEQCSSILSKGKQIAIWGDPTEISNNSMSLLYWALENQFETAELSMIHTTRSNAMNLFLDSIYPSDSLRLPVVNDTAQFVDIVPVMGKYDEVQNINHDEAEAVFAILNQVKKTPTNRFPSIGIVTTTFEQRNLISSIFLQQKQKRAAGYDKILQLERNNLGVYHWSEIEGQKFDIVIFSVAYGIKDGKGKLSEEVQFLNTVNGFNHLYQTLTRASQQLFVCHSIPYSYFDEFYESHTAKGTFLLSALIKFQKTLQTGDYQAQNEILQQVSEGLGSIKNQNENYLINEIYNTLIEKIRDRKITLMPQIGSLSVPIVIEKKEENEPNIALRIDGTFTLPYTPNPIWEKGFEAQLVQLDFRILDTWSANWWRNKNGEVAHILEFLEKIEQEFAPLPEPEALPDTSVVVEEIPVEELEIVDSQEVVTLTKEDLNELDLEELQPIEHEEDIMLGEAERQNDNLTRPSEA